MNGQRFLRASVPPWCVVLVGFALPASVRALSLAELRAQAQQIAAERARLASGGAAGAAAEQALIERLGPLVLAFIDESDRAARAGTEEQARDALRPAFESVREPLEAIYAGRSGLLERQARAVMDADGDLEALYETPEWQQSQAIAARALYYLNWLNFYGARLYEGQRRRALLEAAERGFSEFAVGERGSELLTESILGRGLCYLELGNHEWAARDFRLVIDEPHVSVERKAKARLALLESYALGGTPQDALRYSEALLRTGEVPPEDAALVRFYRLRALFDALKQASGREAEGYRHEAAALMEQLRAAGKGWTDRVDALFAARVEDPAQWIGQARTARAKWSLARSMLEKGDSRGAAPLLTELLASEAADVKPYRAEANYWLGVAHFKAGEYEAAAQRLDAALADAKPEFAAEAAYLRFKALEALMAQPATTATTGARYAAAMEDFLRAHPEHPFAHEARYRLGEHRQAQGDFQAAIAEYAQVHGDPGFELRARFGTLQCQFELLRDRQEPPARAALLADIGRGLERFWQEVRALQDKKDRAELPLADFSAKATLLQAVYLSLRRTDADAEVAALLADFARRFPEQRELLPQAVRLRLAALRQLGQFGEAEREVTQHAAALRDDPRRAAIEPLAGSFVKAGAQRKREGDTTAGQAAERVALQLYEILSEADGGTDDKRQLTVARLYEATGNLDGAATLYEQILDVHGTSLAALSGLARIAEVRGDYGAALRYWERFTTIAPPGNAPWFQGQYEQARLVLAAGDAKRSCAILTALRPAMPGLADAELRRQLGALHQQACG